MFASYFPLSSQFWRFQPVCFLRESAGEKTGARNLMTGKNQPYAAGVYCLFSPSESGTQMAQIKKLLAVVFIHHFTAFSAGFGAPRS
jgi:hypothetical protein